MFLNCVQIILHFNLSFAGLSIIYCFFYQYCSITDKSEFFHSFKGISILFLLMLLYPMPSIISLLTTLDRESAIEFVKENIPNAFEVFVTAPCNTFVINFLSKLYFAIVSIQIVFICVIAWVVFFVIQKKLHQLRHVLSVQTLRARRQLVLALVAQIFVPATLLIAPILIMIGVIVLKEKNMRGRWILCDSKFDSTQFTKLISLVLEFSPV